VKGEWTGDQGTREISDGTISGSDITWRVAMSGPMGSMSIEFSGKVDGDEISGTVQFGSFGGGSFTATRQRPR
jgi:hypothetical protein